jgi:hypothetical protein
MLRSTVGLTLSKSTFICKNYQGQQTAKKHFENVHTLHLKTYGLSSTNNGLRQLHPLYMKSVPLTLGTRCDPSMEILG